MAFHFFHSRPSSQLDMFRPDRSWSLFRRRPPTGEAARRDLFDGGPPIGLQTAMGLMRPGRPSVLFRTGLAVTLGWVPLFFLTALQSAILRDGSFGAFLGDFAIHARSLIAVPVLLWAELVCLPLMSGIARHIRDKGLVRPEDRERFDRALQSTARLRDSMRLEIAVVTVAGALILTLMSTLPHHIFPTWHHLGVGGSGPISPAGWWHALVSVPIVVILVLGWAWRLILWTRFLYLVSRLRLILVPSHPDRAAGLAFLGISVQGFSVLAFALGAIIAGAAANRVVHDNASIFVFHFVVLGFVGFCLLLFIGPLLVFTGRLLEAWRRGAHEYGALAHSLGCQMENRWLGRNADASALDANDFSATTDLYAIVANVYTMTMIPVSLLNVVVLIAGSILPFVPVVLLSVSPEVIFQKIAGILF